ncbi:MAG: FMN-binding protein [Mobilitalea sp.]
MIWGIIAIVICVFLALKIVSRKLKWKTADKVIRKLHIPLGVLILIVIAVHILVTFRVWTTRDILVVGSGIVSAILLVLMAAGYVFRKKLGKGWMVLHRGGAIFLALFIAIHVTVYYIDFFAYKNKIASIDITGMNASEIKDGSYLGEYDVGYIYAKVEVIVQNNKITDIAIIEHDNERGTPAEVITDQIIEQQSTQVDAVSGATNSSMVIEKAVEDALGKAVIKR